MKEWFAARRGTNVSDTPPPGCQGRLGELTFHLTLFKLPDNVSCNRSTEPPGREICGHAPRDPRRGLGAGARQRSRLPGDARSRRAVSYTHLRAHETGRNLVCRLLLE